jgi:CxxC motif-containing protein
METRKFTCLGCPVGCSLAVYIESGEVVKVEGNQCNIGIDFAKQDVKDPRRKVTTTVKIRNGVHPLLPVYTDKPFPKGMIMELVKELRKIEVEAPVKMGDIILENALGTDVNIRASRSIKRNG